MTKLTYLILMAGIGSAALVGIPQETAPRVSHEPIPRVFAGSGQLMYASYCASCHGTKGLGDGPAAPALKVLPTDLTSLSRKNGGCLSGRSREFRASARSEKTGSWFGGYASLGRPDDDVAKG